MFLKLRGNLSLRAECPLGLFPNLGILSMDKVFALDHLTECFQLLTEHLVLSLKAAVFCY